MPIPWPKQSVTLDDIKSCAELTFDVIPCLFQAQACQLQLERKHTILISPTGSGKSITFLLPFLWQAEGVCIVICPLQLLGNQHSLHPALEGLGVEAINLTSETATDQAFKDIANGKYRLVITSPEYVEEDTRFETYLWKSTRFCERVTRIVFDKAHCVLDWGGFRPSYKRLCFLHNQIQHATFLALSATLTPKMVEQLKCSLGLGDDVEVIRYPNDRPNIIPVVHRMQHSAESMFDVAFLIPLGLTADSPFPPKFLLFMKSKDLCKDAGKFLRSRLPEQLQDRVVWVHADISAKSVGVIKPGGSVMVWSHRITPNRPTLSHRGN